MTASFATPDFATHYYRASARPFLNLSDIPNHELPTVLASLNRQGDDVPRSKRVFGRRYMELRRLTEHKMRQLFVDAGGRPERLAPHYLVLGQSDWFKGLSPDMCEVRVDLANLPAHITSATFPDSFTAMAFGPQFGLPYDARPYHERVFSLNDLSSVISEYGLPSDQDNANYDGYQNRPFEKYIEIQVWSDAPLKSFIVPD
ncbi:hypothetical protein [Phyllobacterium zundukense]|uniref:Uncharacterized protein n=1 Tax=Phyllobacterium zundukense TaxID=1867719 RepID=A0ACD4CYX3_9HYPH|nr:hypothetical protein [Phyllobacterium zundukense]UXN58759.1 hypothetical protein N8E88_07440 [Phyllobacterium zundukense]